MPVALDKKPLNPKQEKFIEEYLIDSNGRQAAIRAGYAPASAEVQACRLLRNVHVSSELSIRRKRQTERADLSAIRILEELRRLALVDATGFFHPDGSTKGPHELTPEQGACLASFEVVIKNAEAGDGITDVIHKFKLWDKTKALEMLAKHFALLTDVVRVEQQGSLEIRLVAGRMRVAEARARRLELPEGTRTTS